MQTKLSIITVNYNGFQYTCQLLDSLPLSPEMEVIVVDNGSRTDEAQLIHQRYPNVTTIRSEQNLGFAGGNNLGIKASHGEYLFFINNDTEVLDNWHPELLIQRLESDSHIGMVCPKIRFHWDHRPIQFAGFTPLSPITLRNASIGCGEPDQGQYDTPHPIPYVHGAAMMARREAVMKAGLMPECYFLYYEELDWSMMFRRAGYALWYDPACTVYHKESQSTGQSSPLKTYYICRNRLLFARRNVPAPRRFITYLYLHAVVLLRDIPKQLLTRRPDLAKASLHGLHHFWCKL